MKNKLFVILLLIGITFFIKMNYTLAEASDFEVGKSFTITQGAQHPGLTALGGDTLNIWEYNAVGESQTSYKAYCIDPHMQFNGGSYTVKTGSPEEYLAGVAAILGGSGDYVAKDVAIRAFTYGFMKLVGLYDGTKTNFTTGSTYKSSVFVNLGIEWACNSENESYTNQLFSYSGSCTETLKSKTSIYTGYESNAGATSSSLSAAQSLFNQAMAAAANIKSGEGNETDEEGGFTVNASLGDVANEESQVIINANFQLENIGKNDYIKNINFELNGSGFGTPTIEYSVNNGEWQSLENNSDTNIIESLISELSENDLIDNATVDLKITLTKESTSDDEECEPTSFTITYLYSGKQKYNVVVLKSNATNQDMIIGADEGVVGEPEDTEKEGKLEGEIPCDKEVCETKISTPICEEDGGSDIIAPEEIKKCILDNVDDAGNSYQLTSGNGGVDNNYCKVFCKEDYKDVMPQGDSSYGIILQPKIEDVVCGGYFKLNAHVEGQKDCYTGGNTTDSDSNGEGSIDKDLYIETIKQIQNDMTDAMTDYNEAESQLKGIDAATPKETQLTCNGTTYTLFDVTVKWDNYTQYKFEWDEENEIPKVTDSEGGSGSVSYSDSSITCNAIYEDGKKVGEEISAQPSAKEQYEQWKSEVNNNKTQAEQTMTSKLEEYKKEINAYNSCLTAWTMEYQFAQKLQFYYDETQGSLNDFSASIPYYSLLKDDQKYLEAVEDTYGEETEVIVCKETASEEYVCEGDSTSFELSVEELASVNIDEYGYDSTYGSAFESKDYVICNPDEGCKTDPREISQASFVKKTIRKTQDYITPTVFYQIEANGKITVNSGYAGDDVKLEALENALPISTKAVVGGTFRLMLEDLGEFYDSGEVGRLIDYQGDNESRSVANALGYNSEEGFDGNYECYYTSPCKPDDCPNCEFIGTPLEICPNCDFTPCVNCVFNLDELQINVKPITNTDVVSVDRDYGYNWIVNTTLEELTLLSQKAEQTIHEIEEDNDLVYNSTKVSDGSGLAFSIKLDSAVISKIREYNKAAEGEGGYGNDSLTCYDAQIGDDVVKNVYCYSELIDQLLSMSDIQDKVPSDIYDIRVSESQRSDENNAANGGSTNGYWKLWTDETLNMENISGTGWSYANVGYDDKTGQADIIGGPAWR